MATAKITKVTMFRSSDDKLHATAAECELHESRLSVKPLVNEMLAEAGFAFDSPMTPDQFSAFVSTNADAFLKILAPLLPKKVRAPRVAVADIPGAPALPTAPTAPAAPAAPASQDQPQAPAVDDSARAPAAQEQADLAV